VSQQRQSPGPEASLPVLEVLALAAALEVLLQSLRAFFPLGYHLVGTLGFVVTPVVLVLVFLAPALAPLVRTVLRGHTAAGCLAALLLARLVLQAAPSLATSIVAVAVGLVTVSVLLPRTAGGRFGPDVIAAATLVAFGLDLALRAWRATDDVVWSDGWGAWLDPSLVLPLIVLGVGAWAFGRSSPAPIERRAPMWTWTVLLMPQLLLWTSPGFVGSSSGASLAWTTVVLLAAVAVAMAVLAAGWGRGPWYRPAGLLLAATAGVAWLSGWPVLVLAVLATVVTPLLLRAAAIRAAGQWSPWRSALTATAGWITMFVLLLLYPMHYEMPLPVDNRWLPLIAVVLACLPLLRPAQRQADYVYAQPSRLHAPGLAATGAAAVLVGLAVQLGVVGGSPAPGPDRSLDPGAPVAGSTTVATYNTGQGQDAQTGALAFRAVAEAIVGLDADVVALQEVARGWPLTGMADFEAWLRATTDYELHYLPAADRQFGNALVSRVPLAEVVGIDLGQQGGAQRRSALRARLADGTTVYGVHLQARNNEAAEQSRLDQMQQLVADWDGRPATVVAGDLNPRNEYRDDTETPPKVISNLEVFLDAGLLTTQPTSLCTDPTSNDNCSDYVFTSADLALAAPNEVAPVEVTDHRPVIARLDR
jgi:endonuclease/exonuclease/phosphatase family metal-dependent hydrolase